ncbi:MAG: branched-chain amino acid aminotransferase [Pedosphaera sp.]|nr:branched-chain amino acid aminotransferase [Pedosphaera sp.]
MIVFFNGRFVPEAQAVVSIFDRSFLYGDGLFETLRVHQGKLFRWAEHMERFRRGAEFLKIQVPFQEGDLRKQALQLIERNEMREALLRMTLSRGVGVRGYSPKGANSPALVMTMHAVQDMEGEGEKPPKWRAITASFRLPTNEALALFKTCNKLPQIMARAEADDRGADEALLLNTDGEVVEASSSNLFWIRDGVVCTPPLTSGVLAGVTRLVVLEICGRMGLPTRETGITTKELQVVEGVFVSMSSRGIVELISLDGKELGQSATVGRIQAAYAEVINRECK